MPNRHLISLPATSTIAEIGVISAEVAKALQAGKDVRLATDDVVRADLSLVQVLFAAQRLAQARGQALQISLPVNGAVTTLMSQLGLLDAESERPRVSDGVWSGIDTN